jgi:hypothetical protein
MLDLLNGDWTLQRLQHVCIVGLCPCLNPDDLEEHKEIIFSSLLECRAVLSHSTDVPSQNRWMTCSGVGALIACFTMCHSILPAAYRRAFSKWKSGELPADVEVEDEYRARVWVFLSGVQPSSACFVLHVGCCFVPTRSEDSDFLNSSYLVLLATVCSHHANS